MTKHTCGRKARHNMPLWKRAARCRRCADEQFRDLPQWLAPYTRKSADEMGRLF